MARGSEVARLLLAQERLVADVHWHWVWLAGPTSALVGGLALTGWVASGLPEDNVLGAALGPFLLVLLLYYLWRYAEWRTERLVITDRRLLMVTGLVSRRVAVMPLRKVTDMTFEQPLAGRAFGRRGWGTFVIESAGQDQAFHRIGWLPDPARLYGLLADEIFGENGIYARRPVPGRAAPAPAAAAPEFDRRDDED